MLPPAHRCRPSSAFRTNPIRARNRQEVFYNMIRPSEYKNFILLAFVLLAGSLLVESEIEKRDAMNRAVISSLGDLNEARRQLVDLNLQAEEMDEKLEMNQATKDLLQFIEKTRKERLEKKK